ncbi:hypothetical protein KO481_15780 [Nocardia sp. NEAU-G5]|uniref:PE domain-containing protein n=1 Tax=Nocardia albiluteola TaxID=2842303 RepID=A0ABS6AYM8_9NOCA|nr:hypothetical protein [Nocardia albiluteola]MBU3062978.1 hypothetical protein [Nocardia albiluteola]
MAVVMDADLLRQFGDLHLTQGAMTQTAGAIDQAATIAAAVPVFGPIGSEFLAAYAGAQANHSRAVAQLTEVYEATGAAAHAGAAGYDLTELESSTPFAAASLETNSAAASLVSPTASRSAAQLATIAQEALQVAGQGIGLAASAGGEVAAVNQQSASRQAMASEYESPGSSVPAGVRGSVATAGPAPTAAGDRSQPMPRMQLPSAAPGSDEAEFA